MACVSFEVAASVRRVSILLGRNKTLDADNKDYKTWRRGEKFEKL